MDSPSSPRVRRILSSAVILVAILAVAFMGIRPPWPKPANAPASEFSAARALDSLHRVLKDDTPHPVGSAANEAVRGRIVDELTRLGYQPQIQTSFACAQYVNCATVNNVVARLDGTEGDSDSSSAVLLAAHYDSVPAGPGDSDDGTGMASVLEIARALKSLPAPRHSIVLLIDDGEEAGLLGAHAFVDSSPWAKGVRAAVNLDARGTSGPSLMFETGSASDWAVRLYGRTAAHPAATSIAYTLYQLLPNDTDFTVFKAAGYQGLNFAYIGSEAHYHTPLDNSANVNLGSLQHHGENALPAIVALANADLANLPQREAVFFDLFGHWLIRWQARRTLAFALVAAILLWLQIGWMIRNSRLTLREYLWGMIGWLVSMVVTGLLAFIVTRLIHLAGGTPVDWIAYPLPIEIAFWSLAVAVVTTHAILFARRAGFWGLWAGVWTWWALLAVVISWQMPGLSYIFVVPAGVAALAGLPATLRRSKTSAGAALAAILPLATVGVVGFAPALLLYSALGNPALVFIAVAVGLICTPLAPLCADLRGVPGLRGLAIPWIPILVTALALFAGCGRARILGEITGARKYRILAGRRHGKRAVDRATGVRPLAGTDPAGSHVPQRRARSVPLGHAARIFVRRTAPGAASSHFHDSGIVGRRWPAELSRAAALGARSAVRSGLFSAGRRRRIGADRRTAPAAGDSGNSELLQRLDGVRVPGDARRRH